MERCNICSTPVSAFADAVLLQRYRVTYYRCGACGFVQTEEPYWLDEAYSEAINTTDVGLVSRNLQLALKTRSLIRLCFDGDGTFLDYGAGYGLFVRLMRDAGYDFLHYDKYCKNLFASGFSGGAEGSTYQMVTTFEVAEHMRSPLQEFQKIARYSSNILFTTELYPSSAPLPGQWWYFGLDHGQHISFFSLKTLKTLAEKLSLQLYSNGAVHLLTRKRLLPLAYNLALQPAVASVGDLFLKRRSLLEPDCAAVGSKAWSTQ